MVDVLESEAIAHNDKNVIAPLRWLTLAEKV